MTEENLKERLEKELDYAKERITQVTMDIQLMLDGFDKECFRPVCNIVHLKEIYNSYLDVAVSLNVAIRDIERRESD